MYATYTCPACNYNTILFSRFCMQCGTKIVSSCAVCEEENLINAVYCRGCGVSITNVVIGLSINRAILWREQFRSMGWWEVTSFSERDWNAIASCKIPNDIDEPHEPWIFAVFIDSKPMKPETIVLLGQSFAGNSPKREEFVVATRTRLAIVNSQNNARVIWYKDIVAYTVKGNEVVINLANGGDLQIRFRTPGANVIDYLGVLSNNSSFGFRSQLNIDVKEGQKREFMGIVGEYFYNIVRLHGMRGNITATTPTVQIKEVTIDEPTATKNKNPFSGVYTCSRCGTQLQIGDKNCSKCNSLFE